MSVERTMIETSSSQFSRWLWYLDNMNDWPSRANLYSAQVAAEVALLRDLVGSMFTKGKKKNLSRSIKEFILGKFRKSNEQKQNKMKKPRTLEEADAQAKAFFLPMVGIKDKARKKSN